MKYGLMFSLLALAGCTVASTASSVAPRHFVCMTPLDSLQVTTPTPQAKAKRDGIYVVGPDSVGLVIVPYSMCVEVLDAAGN